jgi:hypothetical protein
MRQEKLSSPGGNKVARAWLWLARKAEGSRMRVQMTQVGERNVLDHVNTGKSIWILYCVWGSVDTGEHQVRQTHGICLISFHSFSGMLSASPVRSPNLGAVRTQVGPVPGERGMLRFTFL